MSSPALPPGRWTGLLRLAPKDDRQHLAAELEALYLVRRDRWGASTADAW